MGAQSLEGVGSRPASSPREPHSDMTSNTPTVHTTTKGRCVLHPLSRWLSTDGNLALTPQLGTKELARRPGHCPKRQSLMSVGVMLPAQMNQPNQSGRNG